nr:uncharacterized protein LOC101243042 [Ciona intestinalis]|eukprot:XP_009861018.3 uncharacterized protein LOC101243042 [Ciona intestinalis]
MCIISCVIGLTVLVFEILVTATNGWLNVSIKYGSQTDKFTIGAFDLTGIDQKTSRSWNINKNSAITTLQAMLILSIISLIVGIVCQILALTKLKLGRLETKGFLILVHVMYMLSAIFLIIGLSVYTNYWNSHALFFAINNIRFLGTTSYNYSFYLCWLIALPFMIFSIAYAVYATFMVKTK